jgi:hypothetical protein
MKKVYITSQGASMKENNWTEGQEITCSESVANLFIEKGIATAEPAEAKAAENKSDKTTKKKTD